MGKRSGRHAISPEMRLAITLRILAGASYLDVSLAFKIGCSTVYQVFRSTCDALMYRMRLPGLPSTFEGLNKLALEFKTSRGTPNPLSGCIEALDGITIKIRKPKNTQTPGAFYCRKGYYAIPVQALVDAKYRFRCYSALCVGSTHDSLAHLVSSLGRYLDQGRLLEFFWIVGDEAYYCTQSLITPVPISQMGPAESKFNSFLSSYRIHVEQSFGQLVARWRILKEGLEYDVDTCARIVCLCMKLHNFCYDEGERTFGSTMSAGEREVVRDELLGWYQDCRDDLSEMRESAAAERRRRNRAITTSRRDKMIDIVKRSNRKRPILHGISYL